LELLDGPANSGDLPTAGKPQIIVVEDLYPDSGSFSVGAEGNIRACA
jgi:hypothetical protein